MNFFRSRVGKIGFLVGLFAAGSALAQERTAWEVFESLPTEEREQVALELVMNDLPTDRLRELVFRFDETSGEAELDTDRPDRSSRVSALQALYIGVRLGAPFLMGLDFSYFTRPEPGRVRFHFSLDLATSILVNGASASIGVHPGGRSFYLGGRVHRLEGLDFLSGSSSGGYREVGNGLGFEIGWTPTFGRSGRLMFQMRAGVFHFTPSTRGSETRVFPDLALGLRWGFGR